MEHKIIEISQKFWQAMERADETKMREIADPSCRFVHIGVTCGLDEEVRCYTSGLFKPTEIKFNSQSVQFFGSTAIVITDCNYGLLLNGAFTTHHFAVTEVYIQREKEWKLVQFSFTALVY